MVFDTFEEKAMESIEDIDAKGKIDSLHNAFDSKVKSVEGKFSSYDPKTALDISRWIGVEEATITESVLSTSYDIMDKMYNGDIIDGVPTRGLKDLAEMKINPDYKYQNLKQQAGIAAEIASTAKENILAELKGTGIETFRADDRPDLYHKNDQFVDKVRIDKATGEIVERVQTKFVGKDGADCLSKLASKKFDKYFELDENGNYKNVDKIEIPRDYYKEIRRDNLIQKEITKLESQLEHAKQDGNTELIEKKQLQIDRYNQIDKMLEQSTVSSDEAMFARKNPKAYMEMQLGHDAGVKSGLGAAGLTMAMSTVDNFRDVMAGEETPLEAFKDVGVDTAKAGAIGYGTGFISSIAANAMSESSSQLIRSLGNAGVPAATIAFGIESYESINDYAQGRINAKELAYDLSENAAGVGGSMAGSALAGAAAGSIVPGAGTAVGFGAGLVGGMVGYAVTTEAYSTAVEYGSENADAYATKAKEMANDVLEQAKIETPEHVNEIRAELNNFASEHGLGFEV